MEYSPDEDWSAGSWIGATAGYLYNDYLDYWELQNLPDEPAFSDAERARHRRMKDLAEAIVPSLHTLRIAPEAVETIRALLREAGGRRELTEESAAEIAHALHLHPIVRDGVSLDLAMDAAGMLRGAEERTAFLVGLIGHRRLSDRAAAFLDRATRLYLWGFEPESLVMCGAVLEAAYDTRFPDEALAERGIRRGKDGRYSAAQREQVAAESGVFRPDDKRLAATIRRARNDTLHMAPRIALDAPQALSGTASLLDRLFPLVPDAG